MRKQFTALLAATLITAVIGMTMLVIGVNAMTNRNGTPVSNSPATAAAVGSSPSAASQAQQIAQLQSEVAQYQAREQQYQAALSSDNQQLTQTASEVQMIQQLLSYLQNRGLITIDSQGKIYVNGN
jgi:hypothetical protein